MPIRRLPSNATALFESLEPRQMLAVDTVTTLAGSTRSVVLGEEVVFTATVTPQGSPSEPLTGMVRFRENGNLLGEVPIDENGQAVFASYSLFKGIHIVRAIFVGNADFERSTSNVAGLLVSQGTFETRNSGLRVATVASGSGDGAANGQSLQVNYTGYLTTGSKFDSSLNQDRTPFGFQLGAGRVIQGWDQGLVGMQVGETRVLIIPPALGYGSQGSPPSIPGNATLIFIVKMLSKVASPSVATIKVTGENQVPIEHNGAPSAQAGTDFGAVERGTSTTSSAILLSNGTTTSFQFTQNPVITVTGANPGQFVVTQPAQGPGDSGLILVRFTPKGNAGVKVARINIFTTDPNTPTFVVRIRGVAV